MHIASGRRPWVVKLGDAALPEADLPDWLELLAGAKRPLVLVPDGGRFGEAVRDAQDTWRLDRAAARRMALLALDQHGMMMQGLCPALHSAGDEARLRALVRAGLPAVWLPRAMAEGNRELAGDWDADGDSLAAWLAIALGAEVLLLVTAGRCAGDAAALARQGLVDAAFPAWCARFPGAVWCVRQQDIAEAAEGLAAGVPAGCLVTRRSGRAGVTT